MPTEAQKVLPLIRPLLENKGVLDLGCGQEKVVPWAVGVDDGSEHLSIKPDIVSGVGVSDRDFLLDKLKSLGLPIIGCWPVVFSSHTLEHLREPAGENLWWWWSLVAPSGALILFLPDEARYLYDPKAAKARNPAHKHLLVPSVVQWHLEQLSGSKRITVMQDFDYSALFILKKAP